MSVAIHHMQLLDPAMLERAASRIRLVCFDVDGTLTDGRLYLNDDGQESKAFHVLDGQGLVLLKRAGIAVAMITARDSGGARKRAYELGVDLFSSVIDKLKQVRCLCDSYGIDLDEVAFMGDDLPDLAAIRTVGLGVAPASAHKWIIANACWVSSARGGEGAARELCDLLLDAQGHTEALLAEWAQ